MKNQTVGGCPKHSGQSFINCPLCATETKEKIFKKEPMTLEQIFENYSLNADEQILVQNFLIAIRITKKKIPPNELMRVVDNWERITKAIRILNFDFNLK